MPSADVPLEYVGAKAGHRQAFIGFTLDLCNGELEDSNGDSLYHSDNC